MGIELIIRNRQSIKLMEKIVLSKGHFRSFVVETMTHFEILHHEIGLSSSLKEALLLELEMSQKSVVPDLLDDLETINLYVPGIKIDVTLY